MQVGECDCVCVAFISYVDIFITRIHRSYPLHKRISHSIIRAIHLHKHTHTHTRADPDTHSHITAILTQRMSL